MNKPTISVIMPAYNAREFVALAIQSILNQTFEDFEFIIVDDGSTDGSFDIIQEHARQDDRIVLIRQANAGVSAASNRGLALARGEFVARMDHDDISLANRFQMQVDYLRGHSECVAVGGQVLMIDADGLPIRVYRVPQIHEEIDANLVSTWGMFHPTLMTRLALLREIGGYSEELLNLEDLDLYFKLGERGRLANLPEVLLHYRQHFNSICYRSRDHQALRVRILEEASKRRGTDLVARLNEKNLAPRNHPSPPERETRWAYEKMWAWWALESCYIATARRHAYNALKIRPMRPETWLLMWCAMRGH